MFEHLRSAKFVFDAETKRFDRYKVVSNWGLIGAIYIPKSAESIPERLILDHESKTNDVSERQSEQIEAVVDILDKLGGEVESQTDLKNAVMGELNISEPTARRIIKQACTMKKIISIPKIGKGNPYGYKLPIESIKSDTKEREVNV